MCGVPRVEINLGVGAAVVGDDVSGAAGIAEQALRNILPRNKRRNVFGTSNLHNMQNQMAGKGLSLMKTTQAAPQMFR
jgi:hypothetical protein